LHPARMRGILAGYRGFKICQASPEMLAMAHRLRGTEGTGRCRSNTPASAAGIFRCRRSTRASGRSARPASDPFDSPLPGRCETRAGPSWSRHGRPSPTCRPRPPGAGMIDPEALGAIHPRRIDLLTRRRLAGPAEVCSPQWAWR
jgi:hypothetical protein